MSVNHGVLSREELKEVTLNQYTAAIDRSNWHAPENRHYGFKHLHEIIRSEQIEAR